MSKGTPQKAIRRFCLACQGASVQRVTACEDRDCVLYPYRSGEDTPEAQTPPVRVIRRFCLICCGNTHGEARAEVRACAARESCALWSFRFGCTPQVWHRMRLRRTAPQPLLLPGFRKK